MTEREQVLEAEPWDYVARCIPLLLVAIWVAIEICDTGAPWVLEDMWWSSESQPGSAW